MTDTAAQRGMSRRRFLFVAGAAAAGAAVVASVPAAKLFETVAPPVEDDERPSMPWEVQRRMILRAHEDVVLVGREEG